MLELNLKIAIGADNAPARFGKLSSTPSPAAGGELDQGSGPAVVHGIDQHPCPPVAEPQLSSRLGKRSADVDLFQKVRTGLGQRQSVRLDPETPAQGRTG